MYRDPDEVEVKQSIVKTDPTASARSAIRRQRAVRYSPNTRLPSLPTISYRPVNTSGRTRVSSDRELLLEDIRRRENALDNLSRNAAASEPIDLEASHHGSPLARSTSSRASQRHRRGNGHPPYQHVFFREHNGDRVTLARGSTVPEAPELRHPRMMAQVSGLPPHRSATLDSPRGSQWPMPPHASGASSEDAPTRRPTPPLGAAPLTPMFAPAHGFTGEVSGESIVTGQSFSTRQESLAILTERMPSPEEALNEEDRAFLSTFASHLETMRSRSAEMLTTPYLTAEAAYLRSVEERLNFISVTGMAETTSDSTDELPPLRRMAPDYEIRDRSAAAPRRYGRSQGTRIRHHNLDGLGDRQRSFSPDDENWETMLTTIPPDERVPSAHSSFTTATASATSQSSNSVASSYGTLVTVPSNPTDPEVCPAEDSDSAGDDVINELREDMFLEEPQDHHHQASNRLDGYQSRLAYLVRNPPWRAHQTRLDEFSRGMDRLGVHNEDIHSHLQRLESEVQRLHRDIPEDRVSDRQRPEERL